MPDPLGGRQQRSAGIGARELLERARPEVAHIVDLVMLKQPRHVVAGLLPKAPAHRPQRLIVDREGCLAVAKPLEKFAPASKFVV